MGKNKSGNTARFWESDSGWKAVEVGDDVLLGAEEYGFAGLEELDPSCLGGLLGFNGDVGPEQAADAGLSRMQSEGSGAGPKQLGNKRKKHDSVQGDAVSTVDEGAAPGGQQGAESVDTLKAKIAKLESENAKLRGSSEGSQQRKKKGKSATEKKKAASLEKGGKKADDKNGPLADVQSWAPFELHPLVERAIAQLGFSSPTEVQTECLPAAIRDRRDVIGAAQTGSGKTLAFGLPIMQLLLQEREREQGGAVEDSGGGGGPAREGPDGEAAGQAKHEGAAQGEARAARGGKLRALILAPTRELAMQVCEHLQAVGKTCGIWVVPIVGGISALKQERLLSKNPEVVVASPGRLWDLMKTGQRYITDLSQLSFLVIDEADRMVQQGHYQELTDILAAIPRDAAPATTANDVPLPPLAGADGAVGEGLDGEHEDAGPEAQQSQGLQGRGVRQRRRLLQTFVFSATLTLPASLRKRLRKGGGGATGSASLDSLMDRIPFRAKPKIVDLTSQRKIADKVEEAYIECGESERDEYLYCILARHPGRTLVFVNAISSVRRLGAILKLLGLPAHPLHAGMQQRARLKALDRFKADPNAIMVATDVAARGLDVKDVRCVVHYQIPASVDVYVHRSGRTARAEAEGVSIALVTPKESARFLALLKALHRPPPPEFPVDLSLMPAAHKRVRLAVRLDDISRRQSKARADKSWRQQNAEAVGIVLSDDSQDEEEVEGARRGKKARKNKAGARGPDQEATAEEIRAELSSLLAEPLQPSYSRKFFTGGAAAAVAAHLPQAPSPSQLAAGSAAHARQPQQGLKRKGRGRAAADAAGDELRAAPSHASTVSHAVGLASSMAASRAKTASELKAKVSKKRQKAKQKDPRSAALQAALAKHGAKRKGAGNRGLVVIPQAFGRDAAGPDALQALRSKLASI